MPDLTKDQIEKLIEACQAVSKWAPQNEPPPQETWHDNLDDWDAVNGTFYSSGLYDAAVTIRAAMREIGITPAEGGQEWWDDQVNEDVASD